MIKAPIHQHLGQKMTAGQLNIPVVAVIFVEGLNQVLKDFIWKHFNNDHFERVSSPCEHLTLVSLRQTTA